MYVTETSQREAITQCIKENEAEKREIHLIQYTQQGPMTRWSENFVERKIGWKENWEWKHTRTSLLVRSTYDVLLSDTNLVRWKVDEDDTCRCGKKRHNEAHFVNLQPGSEQVVLMETQRSIEIFVSRSYRSDQRHQFWKKT